jgi:AcrR family transcriptional regulator
MGADVERSPGSGREQGQELAGPRRDEVLEVATVLFTRHGPATLSLKWVALDAGVPAADVAATWGSVEALLADVLARLSARYEAVGGGIHDPDLTPGGEVIDRYHRIMARALLDRFDVPSVPRDSSLVERWVTVFQDRYGLDERTARVRLSETFALEWGWRLFGPHLQVACGLADEPEERFIAELRKVEAAILAWPGDDHRPP